MRYFLKGLSFVFSLYLAMFFPLASFAAMSSTNYQIRFDTVGVGGEDTSSSSSYKVRDSLEFIQGTSSSTSYRDDQGYRGGIYDPTVSFGVALQDGSTQVAATAITSTTVSVTDASDFAVNGYIVVIQDEGLNQIAAAGKVTAIAGNDITVDFFSYGDTFPTIDGVNDYAYKLNGSTISLAAITPSIATTAIIAWEANADIPSGYSVYVRENHDLELPGGSVLNDVDDGQVTVSNEEYGGRSSDTTIGTSTFDTEDTAFTTSFQKVASRSTAVLKSRDFLTLKAAASEKTINGPYSHTLTVVFVGDY